MKAAAAEAVVGYHQKTTAAAVVRVVDSENQENFTNAEVAATVIQVHLAAAAIVLMFI